MAAATVVENVAGTPYAHSYIYGSTWFVGLWAVMAATAVVYIVRRLRRPSAIVLHASLLIILIGALITHVSGYKGTLHLRGDQPTNIVETDNHDESHRLPFSVRLDRFETLHHSGTMAPSDFITRFVIIDGPKTLRAQVSMNKIYSYRGVRLYQAGFDSDGRGSFLTANSDPWGVPVTYVGYALLFVSLLWSLVDPRGAYRRLLRHPLLRRAGVVAMLIAMSMGANAQATLPPQAVGEQLGRLYMNYNERICPVQTYAYDFVRKLHGSTSYRGAGPEQVLAGWLFYPDEWAREPFIKVKSSELRRRLGIEKMARVSDFFRGGQYILGPYVAEYAQGQHDKFHKACAEIDDKLQLVMALRGGQALAVFPYTTAHGATRWFTQAAQYPRELPQGDALFFRQVLSVVGSMLAEGRNDEAIHILEKMQTYQQKHGGRSLPTALQIRAERIYNATPLTTVLFIANLLASIVAIVAAMRRLAGAERPLPGLRFGVCRWVLGALLVASLLVLSGVLALRWIITGTVPMANGYESMLSVAWFVMLATAVCSMLNGRFALLLLGFGFLLSGFFLLVSHIGEMDPAIGTMPPVLNSPLLSIHVSIIMMSYALLALTFVCAITGLVMPRHGEEMMVLSRLFLQPAVAALAIGIFIGAVWANVSWGAYWTWDPKETWALITLMVYAVPLHQASLPRYARPAAYHRYMALAFLSLIVTYFGVNYVLGGMHAYA